jgi:predicted RNase H-like nuclease (RuvC/YqgF family)
MEIITPTPPPGISVDTNLSLAPVLIDGRPIIQEAPPLPVRKTRGRPSIVKTEQPKDFITPTVNHEVTLNLEFLLKSLRAEIQGLNQRIEGMESNINVFERKIYELEQKGRVLV